MICPTDELLTFLYICGDPMMNVLKAMCAILPCCLVSATDEVPPQYFSTRDELMRADLFLYLSKMYTKYFHIA